MIYRAEIFLDYEMARSLGFASFVGFWNAIDDYGERSDGNLFVRYSLDGDGEVTDPDAELARAASISFETRMPSEILMTVDS